jgi:hypothetical protein
VCGCCELSAARGLATRVCALCEEQEEEGWFWLGGRTLVPQVLHTWRYLECGLRSQGNLAQRDCARIGRLDGSSWAGASAALSG